ncbi:Arc-like DNA binding domain protein [Acinetobacter venetianus]|uniref:Arc-like DNA binding domain protein n=1 Tax=Acinetobacter venetianus TaxID=52133 RepID=A0A150HLC8_9GAMM|nr:Arc family DNA-binding protein [Acinetobacter venetianus]KXZ65964.1 Arc-like DNA binding domain protein [Acinetobacter venetianus]
MMDSENNSHVITVKLRVSPELKQKIAISAKAYNRSMNADMVARLEQSFDNESEYSPLRFSDEELAEKLNRIEKIFSNIDVDKFEEDYSKFSNTVDWEKAKKLEEKRKIKRLDDVDDISVDKD